MKKTDKIGDTYIEDHVDSVSQKDFDEVLDKKDQLFAKINHPDWIKYKSKIILMYHMLKDIKNKTYTETPWKTIAAMIVSILYILNPLDIIPDFIPVIGYIDDLTVLGLALKLVQKDLELYTNWKEGTAKSQEVPQ